MKDRAASRISCRGDTSVKKKLRELEEAYGGKWRCMFNLDTFVYEFYREINGKEALEIEVIDLGEETEDTLFRGVDGAR